VNEGSYCSTDCQKADWRRHKGFCNLHHQLYQDLCQKFDNYGLSQTAEDKSAAEAELIKIAHPTYTALAAKSTELKKNKKYADALYQLELMAQWLTKLQAILPNAFDSNNDKEAGLAGYLPLYAQTLQMITSVYAVMHSDFTLPTCRQVVERLKQIHGTQSDVIPNFILEIARTTEDWDPDLSAPFFAMAIEAYREMYSPEELLMQPHVADLLLDVSQNVLIDMGQNEEARSYLREAKAIYQALIQNHPDAAATRTSATQGLTSVEQLLESLGNKPNKPRPKFDNDLHPIPGTYDSEGEAEHGDPWELERKTLMIRQRLFGMEDTSVVISYQSMARLAKKEGDLRKAAEFERRARELKQKHETRLAKERGDTLVPRDLEAKKQADRVLEEARQAHQEETDYVKAVKLWKKAVPLLEKAYGEDCIQASDAKIAQARSLFMLSQYEAAEDALRGAMMMETCRDPFASRGERMGNIMFEFCRIKYKQGRRKEAKESLEGLVETETDLFGAPKERTLKALQQNIYDEE